MRETAIRVVLHAVVIRMSSVAPAVSVSAGATPDRYRDIATARRYPRTRPATMEVTAMANTPPATSRRTKGHSDGDLAPSPAHGQSDASGKPRGGDGKARQTDCRQQYGAAA